MRGAPITILVVAIHVLMSVDAFSLTKCIDDKGDLYITDAQECPQNSEDVNAVNSMNQPSSGKHRYATIDLGGSARVLSQPDIGSELGRIAANSKIEILGEQEVRSGRLVVLWYRVPFQGGFGWISQYVTTGKILAEDLSTKKKTFTEDMPNAKSPKLGTFSQSAKEAFTTWILANSAVTQLEYPENSDSSLWIKLSPEKYTTKDNLKSIALKVAEYYKGQTGYEGYVVVTIWHWARNEIVVKGGM